MSAKVLSGKDLRKIGYPEGRVIGLIIAILDKHYKNKSKSFKLDLMSDLYHNQDKYESDQVLGRIIKELRLKTEAKQFISLNTHRLDYKIFGAEEIAEGARNQMEIAMKLPVTMAGSLMPDAHHGYGLPIGGVLATKNAVIPYGVGVDIGCRMCLTIYPIPTSYLEKNRSQLKKILVDNTRFGNEVFQKAEDDNIFEREEFKEIGLLKHLQSKAYKQIGSSGSGNHFVEFGITELLEEKNEWDIAPGKYLTLLSHSGSRGLGADIARHYTRVAIEKCKLPDEAKNLAWLDLDTQDGQEYWIAMNLAGDYASACHHHIHRRIAKTLGEKAIATIENHHNFAWKEKLSDGTDVIVHRKGATPAGKDVLGIIPGSMTDPGFIVRGKGYAESLNSASHGAGRVLSRNQAKTLITKKDVRERLEKANVELLGGDVDEAPMVYKDINKVMGYQKELVETIGIFYPKIVRMSGQ